MTAAPPADGSQISQRLPPLFFATTTARDATFSIYHPGRSSPGTLTRLLLRTLKNLSHARALTRARPLRGPRIGPRSTSRAHRLRHRVRRRHRRLPRRRVSRCPYRGGATHRFNPAAHPSANADVESCHATIAPEFFDRETFSDPADFLSALRTDQHCFNFARKNRARGDFTPADLLAARAPDVSPKILLLTPILPDAHADQDLSRPPAT